MPIQAPKIIFWESFDPYTLPFIIETPKRHFLAQKHAFWALIGRDRSYGVIWTRRKEYKKKKEPKRSQNSPFSQTPFRRPTSTKFCVLGCIPDIFLRFEFQKDRLQSVGAVGGRMFGFPIDLAHCLYNSLLLSHKPWSRTHSPLHGVQNSVRDYVHGDLIE